MTEKTLIMPVPPEYMWTEDHVEALTQLLLEVGQLPLPEGRGLCR